MKDILKDRINAIYFTCVQRYRNEGYNEVDSHKAAICALNGQHYDRKTDSPKYWPESKNNAN